MAPTKGFRPLTLKPIAFSLTEGTDIPPPPPSPPAIAATQAPPPAKRLRGALSSHPTTPREDQDVEMKDAADTVHANGNSHNGAMPPPSSTRRISPSPASPTSISTNATAKRPSSVRKLLSFRTLREREGRNSTYGPNGVANDVQGKMSTDSYGVPASRPGSPYSIAHASTHSLSRKRSSGWFGTRRKSGLGPDDDRGVENGGAVQPPLRKSPPPPMLPELKEFGSLDAALDGGGLGADDLFKNIK